MKVKQTPVSPAMAAAADGTLPRDIYLRTYDVEDEGRSFSCIVTRDEIAPGDERWHISVAGRDNKVPSWTTMAAVGHELRPGVPFAIGIPPKSWWINVHEGCLHLYEIKDANLIAQWRHEARGDKPS